MKETSVDSAKFHPYWCRSEVNGVSDPDQLTFTIFGNIKAYRGVSFVQFGEMFRVCRQFHSVCANKFLNLAPRVSKSEVMGV